MADAVSPKEQTLDEYIDSAIRHVYPDLSNLRKLMRLVAEAGERKERERCAKVAEDHSIDGWNVGDEIAEVIRGGESQ